MLDLFLLVADKAAQFAMKGGLSRPQALGIPSIRFDFIVHPQRDSGTRKTGPEILRLKLRAATHALLLLDYEGSGARGSAAELEADLDDRLKRDWGDRAKAIVIEPELDIWMWGSDNAIETILQWREPDRLRSWLRARDYGFDENDKPRRPKEALEDALRLLRKARSAALYEQIAAKISLQQCHDAGFRRMHAQLKRWFATQTG